MCGMKASNSFTPPSLGELALGRCRSPPTLVYSLFSREGYQREPVFARAPPISGAPMRGKAASYEDDVKRTTTDIQSPISRTLHREGIKDICVEELCVAKKGQLLSSTNPQKCS